MTPTPPYPNRLRHLRGRRFTQEELAEKVGVAPSTYRGWEEGYHRPRPFNVRALCKELGVNEHELAYDHSPDAEVLKVAIAVVTNGPQVLLVCRRDASNGISWQFPAGIVKPGGDAAVVAVRETLAETGVHCSVSRSLGSRLHPRTRVLCEYFLCSYLAGNVENRDVVENVTVTWVERMKLTHFIPLTNLFQALLSVPAQSA